MPFKSFFSSRRPSWGSNSSEESHHSLRQTLSGASSHLWRPRSTRRPSFDRHPAQHVAGSYIDRARLVELLNRRFGNEYDLKVCTSPAFTAPESALENNQFNLSGSVGWVQDTRLRSIDRGRDMELYVPLLGEIGAEDRVPYLLSLLPTSSCHVLSPRTLLSFFVSGVGQAFWVWFPRDRGNSRMGGVTSHGLLLKFVVTNRHLVRHLRRNLCSACNSFNCMTPDGDAEM